ncbi:putative dienelactone hydrolase family protein [Rosellinia necatrix]|uniref:Putative dienelactone hydrolase family protein n=1 Tax=Rosellinia necatrix TaxID=77044 RepID=A0A1W2TMX6_ROSNE|nr:putative dienelactone hydrolase family protein [Rosellinia necatrix]
MSKHSEACCRIPPVVGKGYEPKGRYVDLDGLRTYVTGPPDADKAILAAYDIFGFFPQTLQGADILATGDTEQPYQVFIPDFFNGNPAKMDWYPPTNDEQKAIVGEWFKDAAWPIHRPRIPGILQAAEKTNPNIKAWGIMGYCWGGKMASMMASDEPGLFKAAVQTSPAQIDADDAARVRIPTMLLASKNESADLVKAYGESLSVPSHVEMFNDQVHGFMSARADLEDDRVKAEYERGYALSLKFFHEHL